VLFRSAPLAEDQADRRLADFLRHLTAYRRADEAAGHRFTGPDGRSLPALAEGGSSHAPA
jgi:hypothetical protein